MTSEQEQLEQRLTSMEEFMARMGGTLETLARRQSRPPPLTSKEQTDVLRARLRAEAEVVAGGTTEADLEEATAGISDSPVHNHRSRRTTTVREPAARTGGVRPLVARAAGSRPAAGVAEGSARTGGARLPGVRVGGSATTASSRRTVASQGFSPVEIERLRGLLGGTAREGILDGDFTPLTEDLLSAPVPDQLRLPKVSLFDGTGDPADHVGIYSSWTRAYGYSDAIKCRLFDTTLAGEARRWWYRLPANSIGSWQDLKTKFATQFLGSRRHLKNPAYLFRVKQQDGETLQAWLKRFTKATVAVGPLADDALLLAANSAVREDTPFAFSVNKKPPRTYSDFLNRAWSYVNAEASTSKKPEAMKNSEGDPEGDRRKKRLADSPEGRDRQDRGHHQYLAERD